MAKQTRLKLGDCADIANVSHAVVEWALKRSATPLSVVAKKLDVSPSVVESWTRKGGTPPPFQKAQDLAKVLHVPFGFFYLSKPPADTLPLPDFRGFDRKYRPSTDLLQLLNDILLKQDWFQEHQRESGVGPRTFVGSMSVKDSIDAVATAIRGRLGINPILRESAATWSDYLSVLSKRAENAGILVMRSGVVANLTHRKLRTDELLGFAIADPMAPIVFINSADYRASQTFTLAHELSHLWIGKSAIANPDELAEKERNSVEVFCNSVAAEVLVPEKEFLAQWDSIRTSNDLKVQRLARRFWVSGYVTLRRARELGTVTQTEYLEIKQRETNRRKRDKSGGGDYYRNVLTRMSPMFTGAVLGDVNSGKLELRDAASLLGMKVQTVVKFVEKWK